MARGERLRWRLAHWLVGPFVTIPDRNGVLIVQHFEGGWSVVYEADRFRLRMCTSLPSLNEYDDTPTPATRGRFAGTVKVR